MVTDTTYLQNNMHEMSISAPVVLQFRIFHMITDWSEMSFAVNIKIILQDH